MQIQSRGEISLFYEIYLITYRALLCQIRNPMDVFFKLVQAVFTALIVLLVFGNVSIRLFRLEQSIFWITLRSCKTFEESSSSWSHQMLLVEYKEPLLLLPMKDQSSWENVSAKVTRLLLISLQELALTFPLSLSILQLELLLSTGQRVSVFLMLKNASNWWQWSMLFTSALLLMDFSTLLLFLSFKLLWLWCQCSSFPSCC